MEKAKNVIKTLEPTGKGGLGTSSDGDVKEDDPRVREMEQKLIASTFYNYAIHLNRNNNEARNQTMLQKHRAAAARRRSDM